MKTKILRNIFLSVGVLFASAQLLPAGTITTFDPPGSTFTLPSAITPSGVIIGSYVDASGVTHGFLRARDGSITSYDVPPGGFIDSPIYIPGGPPPSVNPAGDITGTYFDASFGEHGFLRTPDGTFTTIDFPGAFFTEALAINPAGVIVGDFCNAVTCFQGFLRTPDGTFTVINANAGIPNDINPAGAITGSAADGSGRGYLRSPDGTFITFNPPGSTFTEPTAINAAGAITGFHQDAHFVAHGFVRAPDGTFITFDPPGSTFTFPTAINPGGVITGVFSDASGALHEFVRIP